MRRGCEGRAGDQASDAVTTFSGMQPPRVIQYSASNVCLLQEIDRCMPHVSNLLNSCLRLFFFEQVENRDVFT